MRPTFLTILWCLTSVDLFACCAVTRADHVVVNADQTVIMVWDEKQKTQHFIRQADFETDAPDVGFIVPSPSRPQLEESGNAAFATLEKIVTPVETPLFIPLGCSVSPAIQARSLSVEVIETKRVAGYDATVLTARRGDDLVKWLRANGYPYSPSIATWAQPYLGGDWHFTVLKLAKQSGNRGQIQASALRITFQTDQPLFPYREPESMAASRTLGVQDRLLRIYFVASTQYEGELAGGHRWSGRVKWSNDITTHRETLIRELALPESTLPGRWWLTMFEDRWPYAQAAGDLWFHKVSRPKRISQAPNAPVDGAMMAWVMWFGAFSILRSMRRRSVR